MDSKELIYNALSSRSDYTDGVARLHSCLLELAKQGKSRSELRETMSHLYEIVEDVEEITLIADELDCLTMDDSWCKAKDRIFQPGQEFYHDPS